MIRTVLLRGAWLMLGAAIGVAAGILGAVALTVVVPIPDFRTGAPWGVAAALLLAVPIGLLPGVREIEVTAARSMLGVTADLPSEVRGWRHRWRTAIWTVVHAATGLATGVCVFAMLPGGVVTLTMVITGQHELLAAVGLDVSAWLALLAGVAMLAAAVFGPVLAGVLAARLAPVLLGPGPEDRLALAEQRLAAERRHTALARELHDGIGHALSIISIQAAAARRIAAARPERADAALHVIEQTSRGAQAELDHLLGLLRDPDAAASRAVRDDLPTLLQRHRDTGLTIEVTDEHGPVPPLVWHAVLDILAEALANAHRHAGDATVTVAVTQTDDAVQLRVDNPLPARTPSSRQRRGGRGIIGMQERASLLDGTVQAGPVEGRWQVAATLPVPATIAASDKQVTEEGQP